MGNFYVQYEYWFAVVQLVLAMLGMGATLTPGNFREVLVEKKAVGSGSFIQLVIVPLIALMFTMIFGISGGVAVGIALIVAVPGGSTSNIFTHFAQGNSALSISITALTTIACLVSTPLILVFLIESYISQDFVMPSAQIVRDIALSLLLPLAVGMLFLKIMPHYAVTFSKWCIRGSIFGLLLIVIGSISSGRIDIPAFGFSNILLIVALCVTLFLVSRLISRVLGLSKQDAIAIELEIVVRNVNLGVMLKASLFPAVVGVPDPIGDTALFALLVYGGVQLMFAAGLITVARIK